MIGASTLSYPTNAYAVDFVKTASDYEWDHPQSAGDIIMKIGGIALVLFISKVAGGVMQTEKNFGEIIEIINESMVIKGAEEDQDKYKIDGDFEKADFSNMSMSLNISVDGEAKEFSWKKDDDGKYVVPEKLKKYVGNEDLKIVFVSKADNPDDNDIIF